MPVHGITPQLQRIGGVHGGYKKAGTKKDGTPTTFPAKLENWRLTGSQYLCEQIADKYGADPKFGGAAIPWPEGEGGDEWQIFTTSSTLSVVVTDFSQWMTAWNKAGVCTHRCDGEYTIIPETEAGKFCGCYASEEARKAHGGVKLTTKLYVLMLGIEGLGTFKLSSTGEIAASELVKTGEWLASEFKQGNIIPVGLRLRKVEGPKNYVIPCLDIPRTPDEMLSAAKAALEMPALPPGYVSPAEEIERNQAAIGRRLTVPHETTAEGDPFAEGFEPPPGPSSVQVIEATVVDEVTLPSATDGAAHLLPINDSQINNIKGGFARLAKLYSPELSDKQYRNTMEQRYGVRSCKGLTKDQAKDFIKYINQRIQQRSAHD